MQKRKRVHVEIHDNDNFLEFEGLCTTLALSLQQREVGVSPGAFTKAVAASLSFKKLLLQAPLDAYGDLYGPNAAPLSRRRSRVLEILVIDDLIIVLLNCGMCQVYNADSCKALGQLNHSSSHTIRSLFHNTANSSLITVSLHARDAYTRLHCRSIPCSELRTPSGAASGTPIFTEDVLKYPGFVEFEDDNSIALVFNSLTQMYKLYELRRYTLLYCLPSPGISEVKLSTGALLLVHERRPASVTCQLLSLPGAQEVAQLAVPLEPGLKLELYEVLNDTALIIKQYRRDVRVIQAHGPQPEVALPGTSTRPDALIITLDKLDLFVLVDQEMVTTYSPLGVQVAQFRFPHGRRQLASLHTRSYISDDQQLLIMHSMVAVSGSAREQGLVEVIGLTSGQLLASYGASSSKEQQAVQDVTYLLFDEPLHMLLCGNDSGMVARWSLDAARQV